MIYVDLPWFTNVYWSNPKHPNFVKIQLQSRCDSRIISYQAWKLQWSRVLRDSVNGIPSQFAKKNWPLDTLAVDGFGNLTHSNSFSLGPLGKHTFITSYLNYICSSVWWFLGCITSVRCEFRSSPPWCRQKKCAQDISGPSINIIGCLFGLLWLINKSYYRIIMDYLYYHIIYIHIINIIGLSTSRFPSCGWPTTPHFSNCQQKRHRWSSPAWWHCHAPPILAAQKGLILSEPAQKGWAFMGMGTSVTPIDSHHFPRETQGNHGVSTSMLVYRRVDVTSRALETCGKLSLGQMTHL